MSRRTVTVRACTLLRSPTRFVLLEEEIMGAVRVVTALSIALLGCDPSHAGGPLAIDHRINADDAGIWRRSNQHVLQ